MGQCNPLLDSEELINDPNQLTYQDCEGITLLGLGVQINLELVANGFREGTIQIGEITIEK